MKHIKKNKTGYVRKTKRSLGPICRGNCAKFKGTKCSTFTQSYRLKIFEEFWSKYCKKKDRHEYLNKLIDNLPSDNGMPIYNYHLMHNNERIRVCREMFLNTLGISIKMLRVPKENSKIVKVNEETDINCASESEVDSALNENFESFSNSNNSESRSGKKITFTKEIGVQCDLLKELWTDFTNQSKTKFSFFENFLNNVSLSGITDDKSNQNIFEKLELPKPDPEVLNLEFENSYSETENKSSSANESTADSLGYQDDVDTMETAQESGSNSETENYFQPKQRKSSCNYIKILNGFKCLICNKIYRFKSTIMEHLNSHLSHHKKWDDNNSFLMPKSRVLYNINRKNLFKTKKKHRTNFKRNFDSMNTESLGKEENTSIAKKTCPVCSKKFMTEQSALDHLNTHTKEKPYKCSCDSKFSHHTKLICHLSKFSCPKNSTVTPQYSRTQLENKNSRQHQFSASETFYCKVCDIDFGENQSEKHFSSENHLQNENLWIRKYNIRKFICLECKTEFEMLLELVKHRVKRHHKRISFLFFERLENFNLKYCYICDKSFVKRINYYDHMNMHKKIYAYACSCGKKFQFYNSLIFHSQKRGCPVEGRILPNYCPNTYPSEPREIINVIKNISEEEIENKSHISTKSTKRIIDITGTISSVDENESAEANIFNETENSIPSTELPDVTNLNHQPPIIYYPQIFNNDCLLDQGQILSIPGNQNNHLIPPQIMPGTLFVYEAISQPNVIQIPQIVNYNEIGQTLSMPSLNPLNNAVDHPIITSQFDAEFNKMIKFKSITSTKISSVQYNVPKKVNETCLISSSNKEFESEDNNEQNYNSIKQHFCNNLQNVDEPNHVDSENECELDENDVLDRDSPKSLCRSNKKKKFYCELCRLNYASSLALQHFYDINHRKLEDEWRKNFNIIKITCPLCPRTTFDKFFGLICHQYKVHGIKVDKFFFKRYKESYGKLCNK